MVAAAAAVEVEERRRTRGRGGGAAPDSSAAEEQRALDEFVKAGGTVVAWNQGASSLVNALRLPVRNVVAGLSRKEFFTGGSIMQIITDPTHPVMSGMPEHADVMVFNSPVFTTLDGFDGAVIAKYPSDVVATAVGIPERASTHSGIRGGARREAREGSRHSVRLPAGVAWSADGNVPRGVQRGVLWTRRRRSGKGRGGLLDGETLTTAADGQRLGDRLSL